MNLENLISKYLDGELSLEEDQELRSLLASDPEAKSIFEESVEMSYVLKKDAEDISTPSDLKDSVEDKILMRIMSETRFNDVPDFISEEPEEKRKRRILPILIPIFAVGILYSFVLDFGNFSNNENISTDYEKVQLELIEPYDFDFSDKSEASNSEKSEKNLTGSKANSKKGNSNINENKAKRESDLQASKVSSEKESTNKRSDYLSNNNFDPENIKEIKIIDLKENTEEDNYLVSEPAFLNTDVNYSGFSSPSVEFNPNFLLDDSFAQPNIDSPPGFTGRLEFSSIAGTEMMQGGYSPTNVSQINNFAQSVAYKINGDQKVGFEIGFNEYTFSRSQRVVVPFDVAGEVDPSAGDLYTRNGISTLVNTDQDHRTMWAVVFAERKLVDYGSFDFSGRVGFGATNSGPLAYGRLTGNYRIINNISLTAGLDMRMFQSNLSAFVEQSNGFKGNMSLIYGINIIF